MSTETKEEKSGSAFILFALITFFVGWTVFIYVAARDRGYVTACGDFYQGKPKYVLVTNPDGTREWDRTDKKK